MLVRFGVSFLQSEVCERNTLTDDDDGLGEELQLTAFGFDGNGEYITAGTECDHAGTVANLGGTVISTRLTVSLREDTDGLALLQLCDGTLDCTDVT